jgi:thioester reductase-like protein
MPSKWGGIDANQILGDFMQMQNFTERMKEHRRLDEDRRLKQENALPEALSGWQSFRSHMGDQYVDDPDVMEQFMKLHKMDPQQQEQFRSKASTTPTLAYQKRKQDLKKELMDYQVRQKEQKAKNIMTMETMDPQARKLIEPHLKSQEQEIYAAHRKALTMGYSELMKDPEVQGWMQQSLMDSVLGGPGQEPMDTSVGSPQLKGLFGR